MAQWILCAVLLKAAVDQRQFAVVIGLEVELGERLIAARGAVVAVAVGVHARSIEHKANALSGAFGRQVVFAQPVAAHQGFSADAGRAFAIAGKHLDHATGIAAVQRGCRASKDFDALGCVEVKCRGLTLTVRGAGGNTVCNQFDAAHAKCGARTKSAGRNLQVLRIVLPVLHHQPRHAGQHFRGVDAQLAIADLLLVDAIDRIRQVKTRADTA